MDGFHPNLLSQSSAQSEARIADLTKEIAAALQDLDSLGLAKAHLTQALIDLGRGRELADNRNGSSPTTTQAAKLGCRTGLLCASHLVYRLIHPAEGYGTVNR